MRKLLALDPVVSILAIMFLAACGGSVIESRQENGLSAFAQDVIGILEQLDRAHETLADPDLMALPSDEQQEQYDTLEEETRLILAQVANFDIPGEAENVRSLLSEMLIRERDIWIHMTIFTRTGDELHRILANEILVDNDETRLNIVSDLGVLLVQANLDSDVLGLKTFTLGRADRPVAEANTAASTALESKATPTSKTAPTPSRASTPTSTPSVNQPPTPVPTKTPTSTAYESIPSDESATPTSDPSPTPTPFPWPVLKGGTGKLIILKYRDQAGAPALLAHWIIDVDPGTVAMVEYPFVQGDSLELSMYGSRVKKLYMEGPDGQRPVRVDSTLRPWTGEVLVETDGTYRFYFDNTENDETKIRHLVVTYHESAPGAIELLEGEDETAFRLP